MFSNKFPVHVNIFLFFPLSVLCGIALKYSIFRKKSLNEKVYSLKLEALQQNKGNPDILKKLLFSPMDIRTSSWSHPTTNNFLSQAYFPCSRHYIQGIFRINTLPLDCDAFHNIACRFTSTIAAINSRCLELCREIYQ